MIINAPHLKKQFSMPEPGTMPRFQFAQLFRKRLQELEEPPVDAGVKAGLAPEDVDSVNDQLFRERQSAVNQQIAQKELAIRQQNAQAQRQQLQLASQAQRVRLAQMLAPKPVEYDVEIAPNGQMVRTGNDGTAQILDQRLDIPKKRDIRMQSHDGSATSTFFDLNSDTPGVPIAQYVNPAIAAHNQKKAASGGGGQVRYQRFVGEDGVTYNYNPTTGEAFPVAGVGTAPPEADMVDPNAIATAQRVSDPAFQANLIAIAREGGYLEDLQGMYTDINGAVRIPPEALMERVSTASPEKYNKAVKRYQENIDRITKGGEQPVLTVDPPPPPLQTPTSQLLDNIITPDGQMVPGSELEIVEDDPSIARAFNLRDLLLGN